MKKLKYVLVGLLFILASCGQSPQQPPVPIVSPVVEQGAPKPMPVEPVMAPSPTAEVDSAIDNFTDVNLAFNAPESLKRDTPVTIELRASLTKELDDLVESVKREGGIVGASVSSSTTISVTLTSSDDEAVVISNKTPDTQSLTTKGDTVWLWSVVGKKEGVQSLYCSVDALYKIDGETQTRSIRVFDHEIKTMVETKDKITDFASANFEWILSAIIIPVLGFIELKFKVLKKFIQKKKKVKK